MNETARGLLARLTLPALVLTWVPTALPAGPAGAHLEGLLIAVDGRPAAGYRVHLIDSAGADVAETASDEQGLYAFIGIDAGEYSLGVETPEGMMAPVATPPVRLNERQLARRDVKLVGTSPAEQQAAVRGNYGIGMWWAGLSKGAKAGAIIGLVAIVGFTIAAITDDDDEPASPF